MDKFQKKITQMRHAIDTIKSDIECMKTINPNDYAHPSNNKTSTSTQSNDTTPARRTNKSSFTQFKDNCPMKKEYHSNTTTGSKGNMSHQIGNGSRPKNYNFNYPLDHTSNESIKSYAKLSDYMNTKAIQKNASMVKPVCSLERQEIQRQQEEEPLIQETPQQHKGLHRNHHTSSEPKLLIPSNGNNYNTISARRSNNHHPITNSSRTIQATPHLYKNSNRAIIEKRNSQAYNYCNNNQSNQPQSEQSKVCSRTVTYHNDYDSMEIPNENESDNIVNEMIDITNKYYSDSIVISYENIIEEYKRTLKKIKVKDELINKMMKMYLNITGEDISGQDDSILVLWKWLKELTSANGYNSSSNRNSHRKKGTRTSSNSRDHYYQRERQGNQRNQQYQTQNDYYEKPQYIQKQSRNRYQSYCEHIMKDFNIPNMDEFMLFIDRLLQKANKNDNFLEGIKKILLSENKCDDYLY